MRFLVTVRLRQAVPPEMALGLIDATKAWVGRYTASGEIEQNWVFAGQNGSGGGIANVQSPEALTRIMTEYPYNALSDIEVQPLSDFSSALEDAARVWTAMLEQL